VLSVKPVYAKLLFRKWGEVEMETTSIEVRQATIDDVQAAAQLFNQYRMFYEQQSDLEGAESYLRQRISHLQSVVFLAWDVENKQAVAFMQLYPSFSSVSMQRSWILNDLYVAESHRRCGTARLLLDAARQYAEQTGAKGLALSTSYSNTKAQALYESFGFHKDEQFFHYYYSTK
jgi:ribosomal protein S18 acetylase RimI-like enzyme